MMDSDKQKTPRTSSNRVAEMDSSENNTESILPGYSSIDEFSQTGFRAAMEATKLSNNLPTGLNWDLYSSYPAFHRIMEAEGNRILELISMVLRHQGITGNIARRDVEEKFDLIVDANDVILERVGCNLDDLAGIRRNPEPVLVEATGNTTRIVSGSWNRNAQQSPNTLNSSFSPQQTLRLLTAKNIQRPQAKFKDKIDNSSTPFDPRIKEKPNSLKPLAILFEITESGESYSHPYEYELELFEAPQSQLKRVEPHMYSTLADTPFVVIERAEDIPILMTDLKLYTEIAVDLEHHSYRTFQGFTCLMQISTRDTDYIIDTLALRDKLHILNEVFTDPQVVKVFHGADHDIEWLQRDLCLYVVNMFDTHQAAKLLNFAHLSLAYLLKHYCNIVINKQFQLADWRIRPLPEELRNYAREDTHYLLYIYDLMKNALLDAANGKTNLLLSVVQRSGELCKRRYERPMLKEDSHMDQYRRHKKLFDNRQMYAYRELYRWRDKTAREEDESLGYVLPNHMLLQISELLPREMQGILACCNPIPPLARQNLLKLHQIVLKAREQPIVKPITEEESQIRPATQSWSKIDLESPLHCPHDLTKKEDFRDDLPTLLNLAGVTVSPREGVESLCKGSPHVTVFELPSSASESEAEDDCEKSVLMEKRKQVMFVSPYERYKRIRPFMLEQEANQQQSTTTNPDEVDDEVRIQRIKEHFIEESKKTIIPEGQSELTESADPRRNENATKRKLSTLPSEEALLPRKKKKKYTDKSQEPNQNQKDEKKKFKAFDYGKVSFDRFQGGSATTNEQKNMRPQYIRSKGKKSKFIGKTNHQSFTYGKGQR